MHSDRKKSCIDHINKHCQAISAVTTDVEINLRLKINQTYTAQHEQMCEFSIKGDLINELEKFCYFSRFTSISIGAETDDENSDSSGSIQRAQKKGFKYFQ